MDHTVFHKWLIKQTKIDRRIPVVSYLGVSMLDHIGLEPCVANRAQENCCCLEIGHATLCRPQELTVDSKDGR